MDPYSFNLVVFCLSHAIKNLHEVVVNSDTDRQINALIIGMKNYANKVNLDTICDNVFYDNNIEVIRAILGLYKVMDKNGYVRGLCYLLIETEMECDGVHLALCDNSMILHLLAEYLNKVDIKLIDIEIKDNKLYF